MNAASVANAAVLTSWKDIARYMGKGVRTVQRWEQDFGLPVRRPHGSNKKAILARPSDLDVWVAMRCSMSERHQEKGGSSVLATRTSLSAGMETARMLRNSQKELRIELRAAIAALQKQLLRLREYECATQDGFVQPAGPWVDQTPQPLGTPDVITLALPSPVLDGSSPMPVSRGNLHAMRASEDPSSIRFPEAMGA
jgi:hypothetical protein